MSEKGRQQEMEFASHRGAKKGVQSVRKTRPVALSLTSATSAQMGFMMCELRERCDVSEEGRKEGGKEGAEERKTLGRRMDGRMDGGQAGLCPSFSFPLNCF